MRSLGLTIVTDQPFNKAQTDMTTTCGHEFAATLPVSPWVRRFAGLVEKPGPVLDLATGYGRHAKYFKELGHQVVAVDRNSAALEALGPGFEAIAADLEDGSPWPLADREFSGIVVTNYLHRPLFPFLATALKPGGILIYETFGAGNERFGKPSNPNFLLQPGELLEVALRYELAVLAYECGEQTEPKPAIVQRIVAQRIK
jgi:SAM-dependent methyltransferase